MSVSGAPGWHGQKMILMLAVFRFTMRKAVLLTGEDQPSSLRSNSVDTIFFVPWSAILTQEWV
jgi:hypothetical protein